MVKKIVLAIFIGIGIMLRLYQIDALPAGFFSDEVSIAVNIKTIAEDGVDEYGNRFPFAFESLSDYKMPGYIYASVIPYKLFGPTILSVRFVALISSILSIFLIGYLAYILFPQHKMLPYYAMAVISLCLFHIHFSRIAYETMLSTTFIILYCIALWQAVHNVNKRFWLPVAAFALLVSSWSYYAARFIIPVFTVSFIALYFFVNPKAKRRTTITTLVFLLFMTGIAFLPTLLGSNVDKRPLSYLLTDTEGNFITALFGKIRTVVASWLWIWNFEFLFDKGDLFAYRHGTKENGVFLGIFIVPYILGIGYVIKNVSKKNIPVLFLILLSIIAGLPSALTSGVPYSPRLLPMLIPLTIIIALGLHSLIVAILRRSFVIKGIVLTFLFSILIYQVSLYAHIYFNHFKITSLPEFPKASADMGRLVGDYFHRYPEKNIYFLNGRSCHNWGHDDLHLWYFGNLPNKDMIQWNNTFREVRYTAKGSPFDAYDFLGQPRYAFKNTVLNPTDTEIKQAKSGSIIIRCGVHASNVATDTENIVKILYMYDEVQRDPFYVISEKK